MNDAQITKSTMTVRDMPISYQMNLTGTKEALALECELGEQMPDWMAAKITKAIVALVELTTVKHK